MAEATPIDEEKRAMAEQAFLALLEGIQKNNELLEANIEAIESLNEGVDILIGLSNKYETFLQILSEKAFKKEISSPFLETVYTVLGQIKEIEKTFGSKD
jgi:hypothetical protein